MASELTDMDSLDMDSSDMESLYSDDSDQFSNSYPWKAFVVVRAYVNDRDRYDCIPSSWLVRAGCGYQANVEYRFPSLSKLGKGIKFRKNQKPEKTWPKYIGRMLLSTDSKAQAFRRIKKEKETNRRYYKEAGDTYSSTSELDSEEDNATKKQNNENKKKKGTKRKQSDQGNKNIQTKLTKIADESNQKFESEKIEVAKQIHSQCNNFYEDFKERYQQSLSILDKTTDYLQKIISAQKAKLPASTSTSQQPDDPTPNGTKWTLRHPEPGPALVELVPNTGVYVSEKGLNECKIKYTSSTEFTRGLLEEIFTDDALRKCSYTGQPPRRSLKDSDHIVKPALDLNARQTLVDYALKYSGERGWLYGDTVKEDTERIINSIKGKLYDAHKKSH